MEALSNLTSNCPDWVLRLNELNGQIEQRQIELAQFAENQQSIDPCTGRPTSPKSMRNRGSTESLRPKGEPEAHPDPVSPAAEEPAAIQEEKDTQQAPPTTPPETAAAGEHDGVQPSTSPKAPSVTPSALERQTHQVMAVAQAKARATLRKSQGKRMRAPDSIISGDGQMPKYRSRSMIRVYYDSYVQSFFEELVKFVSASRNLMRKAKMAAKVAQIKRMAELEMPDDDDSSSEDEATSGNTGPGTFPSSLQPDLPLEAASDAQADGAELAVGPTTDFANGGTRRHAPGLYASGRQSYMRAAMASYGGSPRSMAFSGIGVFGEQQPDVYDELDKGLEYVQSMCEHAAHQFLRDGDCVDEIEKIKKRLTETKERAGKEMETILQQDPDALKAIDEPTRSRNYRPQSMRRDALSSSSLRSYERNKGISSNNHQVLEVDEGIDTQEQPPKLMYRSMRVMGGRGRAGP